MEQIANESPPLSPGMGPVRLSDCIEELLKFALTSSVNGESDVGLSKDFCSQLLQDDPSNPLPTPTEISKGVQSYPLYKHLAASLCQSISSGALVSTSEKVSLMHDENTLKLKEDEWTKLIVGKGTELLNMLKAVEYELHVQEPFFSQLKDGHKTVEGRCAHGNYSRMSIGMVHFGEMLEAESLEKVLPGVTTFEEGVQVYRNFYSEVKESSHGVLAICVTKPTSQLHNYIAAMLSGLSYSGIQRMLSMVHTAGTISEKLPPPTSSLLSSFSAPHNPHVLQ